MTGDCPPKDDSIPFGGECRDDYMSYTYKQQNFFVRHISLLLILVGIGIFLLFYVKIFYLKNEDGSSFIDINSILMPPFLFISTGLFVDLIVFIFGNCEEYYRLDKNGLYYEYKKLLWRTRKTIPLDTIQNFVFNSKVINDENDKGPRTVHYFVHVVTQKKTVKLLELTEDKKIIPEWFAFAANTVLANLTGRDLETLIVSDVYSSASSDKPSNVSKDPSAVQTQTHSNSSNFKHLDNAFLIPPGCELRENYLSYVKNDLWRFSILYAILFAVMAISSIGYWMGFVSISPITVKDFYRFLLAIIPVYLGCFIAFFYYYYIIKETGSLDIDGFHYKKQSFFSRSTKDIPLHSIQEFRSGTETNNAKENSNIKFVEIVVSEGSIRIITENDDAFREWLVDSGNSLLANLKSKAIKPQSAKTPSDDYIGVDEFNNIIK